MAIANYLKPIKRSHALTSTDSHPISNGIVTENLIDAPVFGVLVELLSNLETKVEGFVKNIKLPIAIAGKHIFQEVEQPLMTAKAKIVNEIVFTIRDLFDDYLKQEYGLMYTQLVYPERGISAERWGSLQEKARQRSFEVACLNCDARLRNCSSCGTTLYGLIPAAESDGYLVVAYLATQMSEKLRRKADRQAQPFLCLSCDAVIGVDGICCRCDTQTYYGIETADAFVKPFITPLADGYQIKEPSVTRIVLQVIERYTELGEVLADTAVDGKQPEGHLPFPSTTQAQPANRAEASSPEETPNVRNRYAPKDVARKILGVLKQQRNKTATTPMLLEACGCSREGLNKALKKLVNTQIIKKVKRGVYQLINPVEVD